MSELGNTFLKKSDKKTKKKQKINVKMLLGRTKTISEICKFDSNKKLGPELAVNGLGKLFRKKIRSKKSKKQ